MIRIISYSEIISVLLLTLLLPVSSHAWQMKQAPLMTQWASQVDTNNPLPEYPRPQMVRSEWLNLNAIWQFQPGATNDPVPTNKKLSSEILVPFPMESAISGVMQYNAFSWYRRLFNVPTNWNGKRIILHFDAVDWQSRVYINGQLVGDHKGGYDPFSYDITSYLSGSTNQELLVWVYSPEDAAGEPRGKQTLYPGGIMYTSSSGIWQPVWLEPVDIAGISDLRIIPDIDNARLRLIVSTLSSNGVTVSATASSNGVVVNTATGTPGTELDIPIPNAQLWTPDNPFLYDLQVSTTAGGVTNDVVASYFGMRKISVGMVGGVKKMLLNNQFVFGIGPLDQGFWPDGIYTAPTDAALKYDLNQTKALGFNLIRKHIKVERQRWYYWADKMGFMVWQDMPSVNSYTGNPQPIDTNQFDIELHRMVQTHWNSPAIIMWDIFNESQGQHDTVSLVQEVAALDPYRLVNQASGDSYFGVGDVQDNHSYPAPGNPTSSTQATVDGEYGGIGFQLQGHLWNPPQAGGNYIGANTTNDIATIYDGFVNSLVNYKSSGQLSAAIYTQITDVENEENGLMTYDRLLKPALNRIATSNQKAKTGQVIMSDVLPTSQNTGQTWHYAINPNTASLNWFATNFDDSTWSSGQGGFGTVSTPGAVVRTTWNTSDIWIRQKFTIGNLSPNDITNLFFNVYHDEDCEIYINGVLAGSASGYASSYVILPMTDAGRAALKTNATNVIAVHCHQTGGGQDIDVGITKWLLVADVLSVPADTGGYWNLDETNGTIAADSSGNGNNATVSGATWNLNGRINGCLTFNGATSYAQINRTISNDFTIAFWIKTTQTGGTGQWYHGQGLVDGETPGTANDFGTVLSGSKFALGIGNPDTTIVSTNSINDGTWHHCVATRVASTGAVALYVDGVLDTQGIAGTNSLTTPAHLRFGSLQTALDYFSGSLDDIRIYNRALGHFEIAALYANGSTSLAAPGNVNVTVSSAQAVLNWDAVTGANSYNVLRSSFSGGPYVIVGSTTVTSFTNTNLVNGTAYYYEIVAVNSVGAGADSSPISARPYSLALWLKADGITGVANGANVSDWNDQSGNGDDAVQTNTTQQPIFVIGAMNGLPVVRFNAANSNYLAFARPVQDDFTILCVYRSTQGQNTGKAFFQGAGLVNGEMSGIADDFGISLNTNGFLLAGTGNPDTTVVSSNANYNDGQPHLVTFKRTVASGALALYVDGVAAGSAIGGTESLTSPPRLVLGTQQTLIYFLTGDIAEVKIFNTPLSDADRGTEESALRTKYAIAIPTIAITPGANSLTLSWPDWASAWNLYTTTSIQPPVVWSLVTNIIQDINGRETVKLPTDAALRFFRLNGP